MENNNQPFVLITIAVGVILIIVLALIFIRSGEAPVENVSETNTTEEQEHTDTDTDTHTDTEEDEVSQQPQPTPDPEPEPTPKPEPPLTGELPADWDSLTPQQKVERNPFGCDHETQIIWATDGSCHDKIESPEGPQPACPDGEVSGHPHPESDYDAIECHSHPQEKDCGETVWQHIGTEGEHTVRTVTESPPCEEEPAPVVCPDGEVSGHPHPESDYDAIECHSHPQEKDCGETVWQHIGTEGEHTVRTVTESPPCPPEISISQNPDNPFRINITANLRVQWSREYIDAAADCNGSAFADNNPNAAFTTAWDRLLPEKDRGLYHGKKICVRGIAEDKSIIYESLLINLPVELVEISISQNPDNPFRINITSNLRVQWSGEYIDAAVDCNDVTFADNPNAAFTTVWDRLFPEKDRDLYHGKKICVRGIAEDKRVARGSLLINLPAE